MNSDRLALLLTTHSLEESEVLCHRLGIVVKGSLKCLGTPIHLKTKFGRGYEITLLLGEEQHKTNDIVPLKVNRISFAISQVTEQFKSCLILEQSDNRCRLLISKSDMNLPKVFRLLEEICNEGNSTETGQPKTSFYCVNLSSIEQVFLDVVEADGPSSVVISDSTAL